MKQTKIFVAVLSLALFITACVKEEDFNEDNSNPTGVGSRPVSSNPLRDLNLAGNPDLNITPSRSYAAGATIKTEIQYFSESPVQEINFYTTISGTKTLVSKTPYAPAFSQIKRTDTLIITYPVPVLASGTTIKLDFEILNKNAQSLVKTATIKAL